MSLKRKLTVGVTAVAVAAFAGGAYAATQDSVATSRQAFLNDVANRLHVSRQQLSSALKGAALDQLNAEVKSGQMTQAQANALKQRIEKGGALPFPLPGLLLPPRLYGGPRGFAVPGPLKRAYAVPIPLPRGELVPFGPVGTYHAAAAYLGLSQFQLLKRLAGGKSLAQIATAGGKSVSGLEAALVAAGKARLEAAVKAKLITQAQADKAISSLPAQIAAQVKRPAPGFAPGMTVPMPLQGAPSTAPVPYGARPNSAPVPYGAPSSAPVPQAVPGPAKPPATGSTLTQSSGPAE